LLQFQHFQDPKVAGKFKQRIFEKSFFDKIGLEEVEGLARKSCRNREIQSLPPPKRMNARSSRKVCLIYSSVAAPQPSYAIGPGHLMVKINY
jgi:hypothetical protein